MLLITQLFVVFNITRNRQRLSQTSSDPRDSRVERYAVADSLSSRSDSRSQSSGSASSLSYAERQRLFASNSREFMVFI